MFINGLLMYPFRKVLPNIFIHYFDHKLSSNWHNWYVRPHYDIKMCCSRPPAHPVDPKAPQPPL